LALAQRQVPAIVNFASVPNALQLPDNMYFGEVSGIRSGSGGCSVAQRSPAQFVAGSDGLLEQAHQFLCVFLR
jgi:hypothetical protein